MRPNAAPHARRTASRFGSFFWWDDAVVWANERAKDTGRRFRVFRGRSGRWFVVEVGL